MDLYGPNPNQAGPLPYADITNPQSLNKYSYTYNNPLRYIDPDGHMPNMCSASAECDSNFPNQFSSPARIPAKQRAKKQQQTTLVVLGRAGKETKYMIVFKKFREREVIYSVYRVGEDGVARRENGHTLELRESFLPGGSRDAGICDSPGKCQEKDILRDTQSVQPGKAYSVQRTWTVDGQPAKVVNPQNGELAEREILSLSYEKGFTIDYK